MKTRLFGLELVLPFLILVTQLSPLALKDAYPAQQASQEVLGEFEHTYLDVFAPAADHYINEAINIAKDTDVGVSYWSPLKNGEDALLTQRFDFPSETLSASLRCGLASYNFGNGNFGSGSLWISKDGTNWLKLLEAPTPNFVTTAGIGFYTNYDGKLPESVIGSKTIWLQARLSTAGGTNMAQFLRHITSDSVNCFDFKATYSGLPRANDSSSDCLLVPSGLALWWPGDGNSIDIQGTNHGMITGQSVYAPGLVGQGFQFDGSSSFVRSARGPASFAVDNWTFSAWFFWKGIAANASHHGQVLFVNGNGGSAGYFLWIPEAGHCAIDPSLCSHIGELVVAYSGISYRFTGAALDKDAWTHIVLMRNQGQLMLYKNGQLLFSEITGNPNPPLADGYFSVGDSPDFSFNGLADEVGFFDVPLAESELQSIYAARNSGMCKAIKFTDKYFLENGQFRLILKGKIGDVYRVESSLDFSNWSPITIQTNKTGTIEGTDLNNPKPVQQFYRAVKEGG